MNDEMKIKAIDLAASYFAEWRLAAAEHNTKKEHEYLSKYEGAQRMAAIFGIEASEIEKVAWSRYGKVIGQAYADNNATW